MKPQSNNWGWVISANFAEGLPYVVITTLSVVMMVDMGLSNAEVTAWTSLLAMPWSMKALWSPWIRQTRSWMWTMQVALAVSLTGVALSLLAGDQWLVWCLVSLAVGAFASASYDVACDGFYMQALTADEQSFFVGIRSTAYRLAMIFGNGVLTALVGLLARQNGERLDWAWLWVMLGAAALMLGFAAWHGWRLPRGGTPSQDSTPGLSIWGEAFVSFLKKPGLWFVLLFLLFYRLGEALLSKVTILFLKAPVAEGGLGLDNAEYGLIYGTIGVAALTVGGILGGMLVSRYGLRRSVVPLALALNVPDLLYVWMAITQPANRWLIGSLVGIEQFGYGLGFTAYMVFMLQSAQGKYSTSHYAILTALMALGMNIPSMLSGWLQQVVGYEQFFWVAVACSVPGILLSLRLRGNKA